MVRDLRNWHRIYFMLDGKDFAIRTWPSVPRIGERVMFATKDGHSSYVIEDVLWNTAPNDSDAPTVNVALAPKETEQ